MWCCSVLCGSEDMDICCIRAAHRSKFFTTPIYAKWWKMKSSPYRRTANTAEEKTCCFFFFCWRRTRWRCAAVIIHLPHFTNANERQDRAGQKKKNKKKKNTFRFLRSFLLFMTLRGISGRVVQHTHTQIHRERIVRICAQWKRVAYSSAIDSVAAWLWLNEACIIQTATAVSRTRLWNG